MSIFSSFSPHSVFCGTKTFFFSLRGEWKINVNRSIHFKVQFFHDDMMKTKMVPYSWQCISLVFDPSFWYVCFLFMSHLIGSTPGLALSLVKNSSILVLSRRVSTLLENVWNIVMGANDDRLKSTTAVVLFSPPSTDNNSAIMINIRGLCLVLCGSPRRLKWHKSKWTCSASADRTWNKTGGKTAKRRSSVDHGQYPFRLKRKGCSLTPFTPDKM